MISYWIFPGVQKTTKLGFIIGAVKDVYELDELTVEMKQLISYLYKKLHKNGTYDELAKALSYDNHTTALHGASVFHTRFINKDIKEKTDSVLRKLNVYKFDYLPVVKSDYNFVRFGFLTKDCSTDQVYNSISSAARAIGVSPQLFRYRFNKGFLIKGRKFERVQSLKIADL